MRLPAGSGTALTGDWDGDGLRSPGRYEGGQWWITNAIVGDALWEAYAIFGGEPQDVPVVGSIDDDRRDDIGFVRDGTWALRLTDQTRRPQDLDPDIRVRWNRAERTGILTFPFGSSGDLPVVGDWDRDGADEPGIVQNRTTWSPSRGLDRLPDHQAEPRPAA